MIVLSELRKTFLTRESRLAAVDRISLTIPTGCFFTLLGPSGCGKTTTLRMVAGLEIPDAGEIAISGEVVFSSHRGISRPAHQRKVGMVFQSYAIWPHMTVEQNVLFPLRKLPLARAEAARRTQEMLDRVGLGELARRPATKLSGGQQQRVALARALVGHPQVLLLDEPLSNLDARLREEMRNEIKLLQRSFGITTLYVTHDQHEALAMSDRIAVMYQGRVVEEGAPGEIYHRPRAAFTAEFVGRVNRLADGSGPVRYVRPEDTLVHRAGEPADGTLVTIAAGEVAAVLFLGDHKELRIRSGAGEFVAYVPGRADVREGETIRLLAPRGAVIAVEGEA